MSDYITDPIIGLALGSGSAAGLAHIGVLKVFEREKIPIDRIAGSSIGALIGGAYAAGISAGEMEEIALSIGARKLISFADINIPKTSLVNGDRVEGFIRSLLGTKQFSDLAIPFACTATDIFNGTEVVIQEGDLVKAIRASISIPVIFAPVKEGKRLLVDGGVVNPVPVDVAKDIGSDIVIAVTLTGIPDRELNAPASCESGIEDGAMRGAGFREVVYSKVLDAVGGLQQLTIYQIAERSIGLMQRELSRAKLQTADIVIAPQINGIPFYNFHHAKRIIALGEEAAERAVVNIKEVINLKCGTAL